MSEIMRLPRVIHQTPNLRADVEALDPTLNELSKADSSKFQRIKRAVWDEMIRRYADSEDGGSEEIKKLDNALLHRLFVEVTKVDYGLGKQEKPESPEGSKTSLLDLLNNPGLAPERRREILVNAVESARANLELLESIEIPEESA